MYQKHALGTQMCIKNALRTQMCIKNMHLELRCVSKTCTWNSDVYQKHALGNSWFLSERLFFLQINKIKSIQKFIHMFISWKSFLFTFDFVVKPFHDIHEEKCPLKANDFTVHVLGY